MPRIRWEDRDQERTGNFAAMRSARGGEFHSGSLKGGRTCFALYPSGKDAWKEGG